MSKVYMRSIKNLMIKELSRAKMSSKRKTTTQATGQTITDWEAIRDQLEADSLLASSYEPSIAGNETIRSRSQFEGRFHHSEKGVVTTAPGTAFNEWLMQACEQGDLGRVKALMGEHDVQPRFADPRFFGFRPIHVAVMHGHINIVMFLLGCSSQGQDLEDRTIPAGWRPLHIAVQYSTTDMVRFLIENGADVTAKASFERQPIHEASQHASLEVVSILIDAGAAVSSNDMDQYQPLHYAQRNGDRVDVIDYLASKGGDIEARSSHGARPLHLACRYNQSSNVFALLALGAKTEYHASEIEEESALNTAIPCESASALQVLLEQGVDPDGRAHDSSTALHTAIRRESKSAVELLLKHGANPNIRTSNGSTALHALTSIQYETPDEISNGWEMCQLLLDHGANVRLGDNIGNQVLHSLARYNSSNTTHMLAMVRLAELILEKGADINATNDVGCGSLLIAMYWGFVNLSELLILSGARTLVKTDEFCACVSVATRSASKTPEHTVCTWHWDPVSYQTSNPPTRMYDLSLDDNKRFTQPALQELCDAVLNDWIP